MNPRRILLLVMPVAILFSLNSCLKDECEREVTYIRSTPIYMTKEEIRLGTPTTEAARELQDPGQFYYYQQHIYIIERGEGIHVIDNANPESPERVAFIAIEGAANIAIKNDILYVNNYIDLLAVDISNLDNTTLIGRTEDVFPPIWEDVNSGQVLVEYRLEEVTETMPCQSAAVFRSWGGVFVDEVAFDLMSNSTAPLAAGAAQSGGVGVAGSMARFAVIGDYLYAINEWSMDVISLQSPTMPTHLNNINLGWGIETIFPYEDKLFIGSNAGMFIYDNADPANPTQLGEFQHARACDPVFVKDDYAYVTLRDGSECQGFINQLDLVDISDLSNPTLKESFPMDNPHGLTIRGDHLILCEGVHGLKAFDISDPTVLDDNQLDTYEGIHSFDAISLPGYDQVAVVIGEDGFYQFRFTEEGGFDLLSQIEIKRQ